MSVQIEDTLVIHCGTSNPSTGAATDADSTPTVTVEEDGVAMGYAPTVQNVTTGLYRVSIVASAANGFEAGKRYSVYIVATVGGVTGRDGIAEFDVLNATNDTIETGIGNILTALGLAPAAIVSALQTSIVEGALTFVEAIRILLSSAALKTNGWPSGPVNFRDLADTKNRITGTVDADGNRTAVTLDGT